MKGDMLKESYPRQETNIERLNWLSDPTVSDLAFTLQQDKQREEKLLAQAIRDGVVFVY